MTNKEIQRRKIMSYFIEAAEELIDEVGIELLSLRKIADRAAYDRILII